jgi:hypothetical protein
MNGIPTPFPVLNRVLQSLVHEVDGILGEKFIGIYLQGSFAVGDFDEYSDVDFIVVIEDALTPTEIDALQAMHDQIYHAGPEWAKHLEGSYFPKVVLKWMKHRGQDLWYLDHGARSLIRSNHCNTLLVRWIVREKAVVLAGPLPKELVEEIPTSVLRAEIFETMITWGKEILEHPSKYNNRFYQGFIVLNYCRMLYDLIRGIPGSKRQGADWAKANLHPTWHDLIDAAWDCRPDPAWQIQVPADPESFQRTLELLEYILEEGQSYMSGRGMAEPRIAPDSSQGGPFTTS